MKRCSVDVPDVQVEIYLDLSSKESAAAWPIITDAVREFDDSVEFIYRLSPLPDQYSAFAIAQVRVLRCNIQLLAWGSCINWSKSCPSGTHHAARTIRTRHRPPIHT